MSQNGGGGGATTALGMEVRCKTSFTCPRHRRASDADTVLPGAQTVRLEWKQIDIIVYNKLLDMYRCSAFMCLHVCMYVCMNKCMYECISV